MKQKRSYKIGEMVTLNDEAFKVLPSPENKTQLLEWAKPMKIINTFSIPIDNEPYAQDLTLKGTENYSLPSWCVDLHVEKT